MIATLIILALFELLLLIAVIGLSYMFNVLNKKFDVLTNTLNDRLKIIDDRQDKNDDRVATIVKWCDVLRDNQDTLQDDMQKLHYGVKKPKDPQASNLPKRRSLFDHVSHIRKVQDPQYYVNLSEDDRKGFNHYMLLRALSMDEALIEDMAQLYQVFDKIPSPQFYQLLIALVPKSNRFFLWIKSKNMKHDKNLLSYVAKRFKVSKYQANDYINLLLRTEEGQGELVSILKSFGLEDKEVEEMFEEKKDE